MKNWNLGTSTCIFSPNAEGRLHECIAAGIECIELGVKKPGDETRRYVENILMEAKEQGIRIWSMHLPFGKRWDISEADDEKRNTALEGLFEIIDISSPLKPSVAVIHGSCEPIEPEEREEKILASIKSLRALVEKCSKYGIRLAIECLPRTCIGNCSSEILRILEEVHGLGVCFDTNHLTIESPVEFIKKVGKYIISTHVSDYDGIDERHWLPGKGCNDWSSLLSSLEEAGYDGPIMFEVVNKLQPVTAKVLADNWNNLMGSLK